MPQQEDTYWVVEKTGDKANISVCSREEADVLKENGDIEDWMVASTQHKTKDEMEELIEDHGLEFDPWA